MDAHAVLEQIVLEEPWNAGYGGFDSVSAEEFAARTPRPPREAQTLVYDAKQDAVMIRSGEYTVYDDNGYMDAGWDISARVKRLAIPYSALYDIVQKRTVGEISIPVELAEQSGKRTFDYSPSLDQYDAIESMQDVTEESRPRSYGGFSCTYSKGTLKITVVSREDGKMGIKVGEYTQTSESGTQVSMQMVKNELGY
jgi:hypothetical protein